MLRFLSVGNLFNVFATYCIYVLGASWHSSHMRKQQVCQLFSLIKLKEQCSDYFNVLRILRNVNQAVHVWPYISRTYETNQNIFPWIRESFHYHILAKKTKNLTETWNGFGCSRSHSKSNNTICRSLGTSLCQIEIFIDFHRFSEVSIANLSAMRTKM